MTETLEDAMLRAAAVLEAHAESEEGGSRSHAIMRDVRALRDGRAALAAARAEVETLKRHAVLREIDCANEMARANAAEEERDRMAEEVGQLTADLAAVRKVEEWEGLRGTRIKWVEAPREQQSEWRAWSWGLRATANPRIVATGDSIIALGRALAAQEGTDAT